MVGSTNSVKRSLCSFNNDRIVIMLECLNALKKMSCNHMHVLVGHINLANPHLESVIRWNFMKVLFLLQHGVLASQ